ncbi:MAG: CCA tRNA nucleotidyltransferase [Pirellulaceae bacterium]
MDTTTFDPREAFARRVVQQLTDAGHIAYFAGGCVRDRILGREAKDFDVATNATPNRVREIFGQRRTLAIGAAFGVISVLGRKHKGEEPIEVATFRCDGSYSDGRRPDSVVFSSPEEDAKRRDFTINGLFYDPISERVIDFVGGVADLEHRCLRAIGDPEARFEEDKLRMLRAIRIATIFEFQIEPKTMEAITHHASEIRTVSNERIGAEMRRLLAAPNVIDGLRLLLDSDLATIVFPPLCEFWNRDVQPQPANKFIADPRSDGKALMSALIDTRPVDRFIDAFACCLLTIAWTGGDLKQAVEALSDRWRLSNEEASRGLFATESVPVIAQAARLPYSQVQPTLVHRYAGDAVRLAERVVRACGQSVDGVEFASEQLKLDRSLLDPAPLVDGGTLHRLGLRSGPQFREILHDCALPSTRSAVKGRGFRDCICPRAISLRLRLHCRLPLFEDMLKMHPGDVGHVTG